MEDSTETAVTKVKVTRKKALEFSNPFFVQDIKLNSSPAQTAFVDGFERCDAALRSLSVVLPAVLKSEGEIQSVNGMVEHILTNVFSDLRAEHARITKIADDNGLELGKLSYTRVVAYPAKITCNKAGQYLQLVRELDKLIETIHATWLVGFIADDAKAALERQWRRKVLSVVSEIEGITKRAFGAAQKTKTEVPPELDEIVGTVPETKSRRTKKVNSDSGATLNFNTLNSGDSVTTISETSHGLPE